MKTRSRLVYCSRQVLRGVQVQKALLMIACKAHIPGLLIKELKAPEIKDELVGCLETSHRNRISTESTALGFREWSRLCVESTSFWAREQPLAAAKHTQ